MTLTKTQELGQMEIVRPFWAVQIRVDTVIREDGVELTRDYHRRVVMPGDGYTGPFIEVSKVVEALHTEDVIAAYQAHVAEMNDGSI